MHKYARQDLNPKFLQGSSSAVFCETFRVCASKMHIDGTKFGRSTIANVAMQMESPDVFGIAKWTKTLG